MKKTGKIVALAALLLLCGIIGLYAGWTFHARMESQQEKNQELPVEETQQQIPVEEIWQQIPDEEELEIETEPTEPTEPTPVIPPAPEDRSAFVRVQDYIPDLVVELKYATTDNFTGEIIYGFSEAYLRYGTVEKLIQVQNALKEQGYYLKIWDAFRPVSAQFALWEVCPNSTYVANPNTGYSSHSRGNTVDITLVDADGTELEMPTGFDDFSALADRNYGDCTEISANNARLLENIMTQHGFKGYAGEWWHFSDTEFYAVEKQFEP